MLKKTLLGLILLGSHTAHALSHEEWVAARLLLVTFLAGKWLGHYGGSQKTSKAYYKGYQEGLAQAPIMQRLYAALEDHDSLGAMVNDGECC